MADPQNTNDSDTKAQILHDVKTALQNKLPPRSLEHDAAYLQIMQGLKPVQNVETPLVTREQNTPSEIAAKNEELRGTKVYQDAVHAVMEAQAIAYELSRERPTNTIIKVDGKPDARDNLRNAYNDLLQHMHDHPEGAAQDAAVLRSFQTSANGAVIKNNLSEDQRDNALAGMLNAHIHGVVQKVAIEMHAPEADAGPSR